MIRPCTPEDIPVIDSIINEAAERYRGVIPTDCFHDPYMSRAALESEIAKGVQFSGWDDAGALVGVMGVQSVRDVTLIRHAYVRRLIRAAASAASCSPTSRATSPDRC